MADRTDWQQVGNQNRNSTRDSDQRTQFAQANGNGQRAETPSIRTTLTTNNAVSAFRRWSPLPPLQALRPIAPRPTLPELAPRPASFQSVSIPPIRRMAPPRETATRPACHEPLLHPPPAGVHRPRPRQSAKVTSQTGLLPMVLGRSEAEQNALIPRPRDITLVEPLTGLHNPSSAYSRRVHLPPPTPPGDYGLYHHHHLPRLSSLIGPTTPPKSVRGSLDLPMPLFLPNAVHPNVKVGPQSPFKGFTSRISTDKPLPELPFNYNSPYLKLPPITALAELHPRQYRPRAPTANSYISQFTPVNRSASLPSLSRMVDEPRVKRHLTAEAFQTRPTHDVSDFGEKVDTRLVKFIDYSKMSPPQHSCGKQFARKIPKLFGISSQGEDRFVKAPNPFDAAEAKAFVSKVWDIIKHEQFRTLTIVEIHALASLSRVTRTWFLCPEVSTAPKVAGRKFGKLLFPPAMALDSNWFIIAGFPKFLWDRWMDAYESKEDRGRFLNVQDVFFRSLIEAYNEGVMKEFFLVQDTAHLMNTIVPKEMAKDVEMGKEVEIARNVLSLLDSADVSERGRGEIERY